MDMEISATESLVMNLIEDLNSSSIDTQREAASQLRLLAKPIFNNCILIGNSGAINPLVSLLHSTDPQVHEIAVTALLNLSINDTNKTTITNANAFKPLIHVLETGSNEARENSAITLYSLSKIEENKIKIGKYGAKEKVQKILRHLKIYQHNDARGE